MRPNQRNLLTYLERQEAAGTSGTEQYRLSGKSETEADPETKQGGQSPKEAADPPWTGEYRPQHQPITVRRYSGETSQILDSVVGVMRREGISVRAAVDSISRIVPDFASHTEVRWYAKKHGRDLVNEASEPTEPDWERRHRLMMGSGGKPRKAGGGAAMRRYRRPP